LSLDFPATAVGDKTPAAFLCFYFYSGILLIMPAEVHNELVQKMISFIQEIGIPVKIGRVDGDTFLPGIDVADGGLIVDESRLLYPGDILHEAGHIAVTPGSFRNRLSGKVETVQGNPDVIEAAAISWSYAACVHLGLNPRVVFHEHGYHGRSSSLLFGFELGVFPGLHELVLAGMTVSSTGAALVGLPPFPVMQKWLRD
jgi:hypothetical protein